MADRLTFHFDGEALSARKGQSLAAALTEAGKRVLRRTDKQSPRGVFCGMGVCQDCLVTVNGVANQRACMTPVAANAQVSTQQPRPDLVPPLQSPQPAPGARELTPDVLVIGAGAGGLNAALMAARAGARVLVLDERKVPGGQYFKQAAKDLPPLDTQQLQGASLLADARASGAELLEGVEIWGVFTGPELYAIAVDQTPLILRPRQLIVATGAYERPLQVPGWTLPGVMTTGAAQTLWRSYRTLPGKRVAVCGSGPLNLQVALELARGGAEVRLVAESAASPLRQPSAAAGLLLSGPALTLKGLGMRLGLQRARVPVSYRTTLTSVSANPQGGLLADFSRNGVQEILELDALCMNSGFEPQNEILRLLGAELRFDPAFGHLRCVRSDDMLTSAACVYAVGDCCGLGGAPAAAAEGRIAGASAARACGLRVTDELNSARRTLSQARRFQHWLWQLYHPAPRPLSDVPDDTIICRCEEITLGDLRVCANNGVSAIGRLKSATRVGMGCCQGRYCGAPVARLLAEMNRDEITDRSYFAPQVPIKPVSVGVVLATQEAMRAKR